MSLAEGPAGWPELVRKGLCHIRHGDLNGLCRARPLTIDHLHLKQAIVLKKSRDDFHPAANRRKMAAGEPLTDADRRPWLEELARLRDRVLARGERAVLACSALKRSYRETLRRGALREVAFVHLTGPRQVLAERLDGRTGHFMPADLLDSQLAILETPEEALTIDVTDPPPVLVERIVAALESTAPGG